MRNLTPTIILNFQGKNSVKEKYQIVLRNVVDIVATITEKRELREAKLLLMEALAVIDRTERRIWDSEQKHSYLDNRNPLY